MDDLTARAAAWAAARAERAARPRATWYPGVETGQAGAWDAHLAAAADGWRLYQGRYHPAATLAARGVVLAHN